MATTYNFTVADDVQAHIVQAWWTQATWYECFRGSQVACTNMMEFLGVALPASTDSRDIDAVAGAVRDLMLLSSRYNALPLDVITRPLRSATHLWTAEMHEQRAQLHERFAPTPDQHLEFAHKWLASWHRQRAQTAMSPQVRARLLKDLQALGLYPDER
jgi:hypothetical protein